LAEEQAVPVVLQPPLVIETADLLRREAGNRRRDVPARLLNAILEVQLVAEEERLVRPAYVYEACPVASVQEQGLCLAGGARLDGRMIATRLRTARRALAMVGTIGPDLERRSQEWQEAEDPFRALLLDGIGNAAVDALSREMCRAAGALAAAEGMRASGPLAPGIHGIPLSNQPTLLGLAGAERIGVRLSPGWMMTPVKSVSMVIGIGPDLETWDKAQACAWCNLKTRCDYRVVAPVGGDPRPAGAP
jgi:hypothetical protein